MDKIPDPSTMDPITALLLLAAALFGIVYAVLAFLAPFYLYGAWKRAKECSEKLSTLIELTRRSDYRPPNL